MLIDDISSAELYFPMRNWVLWTKSGNALSIGYPRFSPSCREHQSKTGGIYTPPPSEINEDEAEMLDTIILSLPPDLLAVVKIHYLKPGGAKTKIANAEMTKATFYSKLHSARRIIYIAFVSQTRRENP